MAYYMIAAIILSAVGGISFDILLTNTDYTFNTFNLVEILFLFSISYIFEYGYEIQQDSQEKIYGETDK